MTTAPPAREDQSQAFQPSARDAAMKIPRRFANRFRGATVAAAAMAVLFQGGVAQGSTWKATPSNANWNDSANWDILPVGSSALVFGTSSITTHNNNLAADLSIAGITFSNNASVYTLAGNRITLTGNVTVGTGIASEAINFDMQSTASRDFTVNSGTLTLGGAYISTQATNGHRVRKFGPGTLVLANTGNSYANLGDIQLHFGTVRSGASNVLPDKGALLLVGNAGNTTFDLAGYDDTITGDTSRAIFFNAGSVGFTSTVDTGGGTLTIGNNILRDSASYQAKLIKGNLNLGAATRTIGSGPLGTLVISANISGNSGVGLTLSGATMLSGANSYTGPTSINGPVIVRSASALGTGSLANVTAGNNLTYSAATDAALNIGGTLSIGNIGTSIGNGADSAQINVAGNASGTIGTVNIYGVNGVSHYAGLATLIHGAGGSTLAGTPTLGLVYNNTDFTVAFGTAAFTRTATDLQVTTASATALSGNVNWKGGLGSATGVWAASNGSTQSNWQVTDGVNQPLAPGSTADVVFSTATTPGTLVGMTLGTDMTVRSLTINNTATAFGLLFDGYALTIAPTSSSAGITIAASVQASNINADIVLGAAQTWTNNSVNALTVAGIVSGANSLTKAGTGTVTLNGFNPYSGDTTLGAGTLKLGASATINNTPLISIAAGATFDVSAISIYGLSSNNAISGSGTGTAAATAAKIIGGSGTGDIVGLGTRPITLNLASGLSPGDTTHPALYVSQGTLSLGGNPFTVNAALPLDDGTYRIIQVGNGTAGVIIDGGGYPAVTGTAVTGKTGTISVSSGNVILTVASGGGSPAITLTGAPIVAVNTTYGTPSATPTSFTVSGSDLTGAPGNLTVTPPSGYEVSLSSGSGYATSLSVPYTGSTLTNTTVHVRLAATAGVGGSPYSGDISVSGGGVASPAIIATVPSTVSKADSVVTTWPTASSIAWGQTLASSNLTGGSVTPAGGTFAFTSPTTKPPVGTALQNVTYTPAAGDVENYNTASGQVNVTVTPNFGSWIDSYFPGETNTAIVGPDADPDHDGLTNQQEYAFGLDPNDGASCNPITVQLNKTTGKFTYTRRDPALTGLTYLIQTTTTLKSGVGPGDWATVAADQSPSGTGDVQTVVVTLPDTVPLPESALFVRVSAQ